MKLFIIFSSILACHIVMGQSTSRLWLDVVGMDPRAEWLLDTTPDQNPPPPGSSSFFRSTLAKSGDPKRLPLPFTISAIDPQQGKKLALLLEAFSDTLSPYDCRFIMSADSFNRLASGGVATGLTEQYFFLHMLLDNTPEAIAISHEPKVIELSSPLREDAAPPVNGHCLD